jgi:hypothetical protein
MTQYLFDEHVPPAFAAQLRSRSPDLTVWVIGDSGAPIRGTLDPDVLVWCEQHGFVLVTNNRRSMPVHLEDHLRAGRHSPGILTIKPDMGIGETLDELILVAELALPADLLDRIVYLPLVG